MEEDSDSKQNDNVSCKYVRYGCSSFWGKIRQFDEYGQPVMFNYQGGDTFQTVFGGLMSIVAFLTFMACFLFKLNVLL